VRTPDRRTRVLVADDSSIMLQLVSALMLGTRFEPVACVADGETAVRRFEELRPDLVLLDFVLPKLSGLEALKRIRAIDSKARVIIMSVVRSRDEVIECRDAGAASYLVKPFDPKKFIEALGKAMGGAPPAGETALPDAAPAG
jgi:two-component system chemotaxis response regulator CheY